MIKILHILGGFNYGGAENLLINIFRKIDRENYQMDFLLRNQKNREEILNEIRENGGKIYLLESGSAVFSRKAEEQFFKEHAKEYDLIHLHANTAFYSRTLYFAHKYGIPVRIMHSHNSNGKNRFRIWIHYWKRRAVKKYATVNLACSTAAGVWMFGREEFTVVENGIDLQKYRYKKEREQSLKEEYGLDGCLVIGTVGRIVKEKNHIFLVKILRALLEDGVKAKLVIIGSTGNKCYDSLLSDIQAWGMEKEVTLTGAVENVHEMLNMFDVFVLPSFYEGLPIALVEAQANGLPCLVSNTVSDQSVFHKNVRMLSLENGPKIWADQIKKVSEDEGRTEIDEALYQSAYSIETTVKRVEKIYKTEVVGQC